jgi:hypothetical protein
MKVKQYFCFISFKNLICVETCNNFTLDFIKGNDALGNFVNGVPRGNGTLHWITGDSCSGEIRNYKCTGIKTNSSQIETKGQFGWKFNHIHHGFKFGEFAICLNGYCK